MFQSLSSTQVAAALTIGAFAALAVAGPALADTDQGAARNDTGQAPATDIRQLLNDIDTPLPPAKDVGPAAELPTVLNVDGGLEVLQIGFGALAGAAFTAAGVAVVSRRRHQLPDPA